MKLIQCAALFAIAMPLFAASLRADRIPVKVVVITTFQSGKDDDPTGGEFGNWVLNLPLSVTIPFPQGYHHLRLQSEIAGLRDRHRRRQIPCCGLYHGARHGSTV